MDPVRFGPEASLVGMHHSPSSTPANGAVLICGPPGPEASSLHRTLRVLADRLARAGYHVLRFDYYGTGDSLGEPMEVRIARWENDIRAAHAELLRLAGAASASISWVGFRLGATIAARATGTESLHCLILWDPVMDGTSYLADLSRAHQVMIGRVMEFTPEANSAEALGLAIPVPFRAEMESLRIPPLTALRTCRLVVFGPGPEPAPAWTATPEIEFLPIESDEWDGIEALESTVLRTDVVSLVFEKLASK